MDAAALAKTLQDGINECKVPGAALAVLRGGQITEAAAGVINMRTGVDTTPDTVFQIGSITKLLTSVLTMQLVQEGRFKVDDAVRSAMPEFSVADAEASDSITVAQLLSHTSGLDGDFFEDTGRGFDAMERFVLAMRALPQLHAPGSNFSYCNAGFAATGRLIERLRGDNWHELLRARIFKPLEMKSFGSLPERTLSHRAAIGHVLRPAKGGVDIAPNAFLQFSNAAAGSTPFGSAADLLKFARAVIEPANESLLARPVLESMWQPRVTLPPFAGPDEVGLAFMRWNNSKPLVIGHDGGTIGQFAFLRMVPEAGCAVALLTNGGQAAVLFRNVVGPILRQECGVALPELAQPTGATFEAARYVGRFKKLSQQIDVAVGDGDTLSATVTPRAGREFEQKFVLRYAGNDVFASELDGVAGSPFIFSPPGVHMGLRLHPRVG